jgi:CMP-N-acetylneuraminic acid synthetase
VVISTDSRKIAEVAQNYGAEAPFLRPTHLASDDSPILETIKHAVAELEGRGDCFDAVCLLQPTAPFRSVADLENAIDLLSQHPEADSVVALTQVIETHPKRLRRIVDGRVVQYLTAGGDREGEQRQDHGDDMVYRRCGALYLFRRDTLLQKNSIYGDIVLPYVTPAWRSINIDEEEDLLLAQAMLKSKKFRDRLAHVRQFFQ